MLNVLRKIASLKGEDGYVVLSKQDVEKLDETALRILSEIGFKVSHPRVVGELKKKGYQVDGDIVRVKPSVIKKLLEGIPKHEEIKQPGKGSVNVGYLSNQIYDADKDMVRYPTKQDLDQATVVGLSLPEVARVGPLFEPKDVPGREDVLMLDIMLRRVKDAASNEILNKSSIPIMIKMCQVIAGTKEEVLKKQMLVYYSFITSPLRYNFETLEMALAALDEGIPVIFGMPMNIAGASAPVTFAGTLAMALADAYSALILSRVFDQGWSAEVYPIVMDQRTGAALYAGPDRATLSMAATDLYRYLGRGSRISHLTSSDETKPGILAGIEKAYTAMLNLLTGYEPRIIHGGLLGPGGLVGSIEQIVIDAEIVSMLNRIVDGIEVNDETIAFEVIKEMGFEGRYFEHEHTAKHFREELWLPRITRRLNPSAWNEEKPDMLQEARKKVKEILSSNDPRALSPSQEKELDRIISS